MTKEQLTSAFQLAKGRTESVSFEEIKGQFLESLESTMPKTKSGKWSVSISTILLSIVLIGILSALLFAIISATTSSSYESNRLNSKHQVESSSRQIIQSDIEKKKVNSEKQLNQNLKAVDNLNTVSVKSITSTSLTSGLNPIPFQKLAKPNKYKQTLQQADVYRYPKLTEKEIKLNNKRKKKFIGKIGAFDDKRQALFNSGEFNINDELIAVDQFLIEKNEVTNLEYHIFLFDLLIQNRRAEFRIAEPRQELWTELLGDSMAYLRDNYFSSEEYNYYPVVNVSRKGAEMYCEWLTTEVEKIFQDDLKSYSGTYRIPSKNEWLYAATEKGTLTTNYPWGSNSTYNEWCFLANYKLDLSEIDQLECEDSKNARNALTTAGYTIGKRFVTVSIKSYNPSQSGLYNLCGNVAEMILDENKPGTIGGGWMNTKEQLKFNVDDPHAGLTEAHPNIGFRVIRTDIGGEKE